MCGGVFALVLIFFERDFFKTLQLAQTSTVRKKGYFFRTKIINSLPFKNAILQVK